jgi:hypothetical protein
MAQHHTILVNDDEEGILEDVCANGGWTRIKDSQDQCRRCVRGCTSADFDGDGVVASRTGQGDIRISESSRTREADDKARLICLRVDMVQFDLMRLARSLAVEIIELWTVGLFGLN